MNIQVFNGVLEDNVIQRYPNHLLSHLTPKGQHVSSSSVGTELRFVSDASNVQLTMTSSSPIGFHLFVGGLYVRSGWLFPDKTTYRLKRPERSLEFAEQKPKNGWKPDVFRIVFDRQNGPKDFQSVTLESVTHDGRFMRPPKPEEVPNNTVMFYGSSITHGTKATSILQSYPFLIGEHLHVNVWNGSMPGSCLMEPTTAEYLASLPMDYAVLELGVNARNRLSIDEFRTRVTYLIDEIHSHHPDCPIFLITIFPNLADFVEDQALGAKQREFRTVLRSIANEQLDRVYLIEGDTLLDQDGLSADLVHPSDTGYQQIASRLIRSVRHILRGEKI